MKSNPINIITRRVLSYREHHNPGFYGPEARERILLLECLHEVHQIPAEPPAELAECHVCLALSEGGSRHYTLWNGVMSTERWDPVSRAPVRTPGSPKNQDCDPAGISD